MAAARARRPAMPVGPAAAIFLLAGSVADVQAQGPGVPQMEIQVLPDRTIELSWPSSASSFGLESAGDLATGIWSPVRQQAGITDDRFRIALDIGGERRFFRLRDQGATTIESTSPFGGEGGVAVTRETVIRFNNPVADVATWADGAVVAAFGGVPLAAREVLSRDRRSVTLFYDRTLPGGASIRLTLRGDLIPDAAGRLVDGDADGEPGGAGVFSFTTASLTPVPGTGVVGRVFASELGMENGEPVDRPLEGVLITLDGKENDVKATTDAEGRFALEPVPAGEFFVHIDGRNARGSRWPNGDYYPSVGKSWRSIPGRSETLAGGTGTIYLPLVRAGTLRPVSAVEDTEVLFPEQVLAENPGLEGVSITVPADALFRNDGVRGGRVGIAPVPPDRLPGALPEMFRFPLVITVQTDGAENFSIPAPVRFPNLPDPVSGEVLPPGAKTALWSFNHDTGRWEMQGPATISEDGLFAVSDPGVGIRAPGWHAMNPGSDGDEGGGGPDGPNNPGEPGGPGDPDRRDDPCDKALVDSAINGIECVTALASTVPLYGCAIGLTSGAVFTAISCYRDREFGNCEQAVMLNMGLAVLGCIPGFGAGTAATTCLIDFGNSSASVSECIRGPGPRGLEVPDALSNGFHEQAWLWIRASEMVERILGEREWILVDTPEYVLVDAIFKQLERHVHAQSEEGSLVSAAEGDALRALPRPGNITPDHLEALISRCNRMARNELTPEELDMEGIVEAGEALVERLTRLEGRGWRTTIDGLNEGLMQLAGIQESRFHSGSGTGEPYSLRANLFFRLTNLTTGFEQRGRLGGGGQFDGVFLSPDTPYRVEYADAEHLEIGITFFRSAAPGNTVAIPPAIMVSDAPADSDGDRLTNQVEIVLGTLPDNADSDGDGVPDGAEIVGGSDPLDGIPVAAGIVASVDGIGDPQDIVVFGNLAALPTTFYGVALVDVADPLAPELVSQIRLPQGLSERVAGAGDRLMIGLNSGEIVVMDVSDPRAPRVSSVYQPNGSYATAMTASGPHGFVGLADGRLLKMELATGDIVWETDTGFDIDKLAVSRGRIFDLTLHRLLVFEDSMEPPARIGALELSTAHPTPEGRALFVGRDVAYVGIVAGIVTVDLSEPASPAVIAMPPVTGRWARDLAHSGTGLLLAASDFFGDANVTVYDARDPAVVDSVLAGIDTPGRPGGVAMHKGLVLVADGQVGMQVVNFQGADTGSAAPEVALEAAFDLEAPQVDAGVATWVHVDATDDHQVREVELYIDGELAGVDGSHPFEFSFVPPELDEGRTSFTLRARAADMAGRSTWSERLEVGIAPGAP